MSDNLDKVDLITRAGKEHLALATNKKKAQNLCWIQHPFITEHINFQISGNKKTDWLTWFKHEFTHAPFQYGLSLGCGTGVVEREVLEKGICLEFDGIDITADSIQSASQLAKDKKLDSKLHYSVQDVNKVKLQADKYDLILISHALHHVEKLEYVLKEMRKALKPDGILLLSEYIGPSQFQFTDIQLQLMNELLETIPKEYRRDLSVDNEIAYKGPIIRPTREYMNQVDPSESIRSDEIPGLLIKYFDIIVRKDYGGTLLQFLLSNIAGNFNPVIENDRKILEELCTLESKLIEERKLSSDFAVFVAKHKPEPVGIHKLFRKLGLN